MNVGAKHTKPRMSITLNGEDSSQQSRFCFDTSLNVPIGKLGYANIRSENLKLNT